MQLSHQCQTGFTLMELLMVISLIGILAAVAIPSYSIYLKRAKISEAFFLASSLTHNITEYYSMYGKLPVNLQALALPPAAKLSGQYVSQMEIVDGAIHIQFGKADEKLANQILTLRPALVIADPPVPAIHWVCGYAEVIEGMTVFGENQTTLAAMYLPKICLAN